MLYQSAIGMYYITGNVSRRCIKDDTWDETINCFRQQTGILREKVMMLFSSGPKPLIIILGYKSY